MIALLPQAVQASMPPGRGRLAIAATQNLRSESAASEPTLGYGMIKWCFSAAALARLPVPSSELASGGCGVRVQAISSGFAVGSVGRIARIAVTTSTILL